MPLFNWRGKTISAPSLEAIQKYIKRTLAQPEESESPMWELPKKAEPYITTIESAEKEYNLPPKLLARVLHQESSFDPSVVSGKRKSPAGAIGIAQFMPATAEELGIDPTVPDQAIPAAGKYLRQLHDMFGNWQEALAAYNWGMGNVRRKGLDKAPEETRNYYTSILGDLGLEP